MENEKHDFGVEKHVNKKVLPSPVMPPEPRYLISWTGSTGSLLISWIDAETRTGIL